MVVIDTDTVTISVTGMTCMSCVNNIEAVIGERNDVKSIRVSLSDNEAVVEYYTYKTDIQELCEAIEDMGFDAEPKPTNNTDTLFIQQVTINVEGMTCQSCVSNIESVIGERTHVRSVKVSLENRTALIEYDSRNETPPELREAICDMGFDAYLPDSSSTTTDTATIDIIGMTCMSCVNTITETMSGETGVVSIVVSLTENNAVVVYDGTLTSVAAICERIEDMGFDATLAGSPAVINTGERFSPSIHIFREESLIKDHCED